MKLTVKKQTMKMLSILATLSLVATGCSANGSSSTSSSSSSANSISSPSANSSARPDQNMQMKIATTESVIENGLSEKPWVQPSFVASRMYRALFLATPGTTSVETDLVDTYNVSQDGLVYTLTLKDTGYWSDGKPITLEDVIFSIETALELSTEQIIGTIFLTSFSNIEGVEEFLANPSVGLSGLSIDGDTLSITLTTPNNLLLQVLSQFIIFPEHGFEDVPATEFYNATEFWQDPICSGMYQLGEHIPEESITLVYNEYYPTATPYINSLLLRSDFTYAELDYTETNDVSTILDYRMLSNQSEYHADSIFYRYFVFNINKGGEEDPVLGDVRVRQALTYAIDREALVRDVYYGIGTVNNTGAVQVYDSPIDVDYPYDPERAKELLAEAEYDFARPITLLYYYTDDVSLRFMDAVANYLEEIGLTVELIQGSLYSDEHDHYDMGLKGLSVFSVVDWYNEYLSSSQVNNTIYYVDGEPLFDDLITQLNQVSSIAERSDVLIQLQELEYELLYKYPVFIMGQRVYLSDKVEIPSDLVFGDSRYKYYLDFAEWKIVN